jgi:hypothetical protein
MKNSHVPFGFSSIDSRSFVISILLSIVASGVVFPRAAHSNPRKVNVPAPQDVAAPPATAKKTTSGLASRVLEPGTGAYKGQKGAPQGTLVFDVELLEIQE